MTEICICGNSGICEQLRFVNIQIMGKVVGVLGGQDKNKNNDGRNGALRRVGMGYGV